MAEPAGPQTDNAALNSIADLCAQIEKGARGHYDSVSGVNAQAVSDSLTYTRAADSRIVKTVVTNTGSGRVHVKEGGVLVASLAQYETWTSPQCGSGAIAVSCPSGQSSDVSVASYLRDDLA